MYAVGTKVPEFSLLDDKGNLRHLNEFFGKPLVIYFYPKDDTPGCTKQACAFRDMYDDFLLKDVTVIGVSKDSPESHQAFKKKFNLPFTLLSDPSHEVCELFGVWVEKKKFGQTYMGIQRSTFVLDESGVITNVFEKASPDTNAKDILDVL